MAQNRSREEVAYHVLFAMVAIVVLLGVLGYAIRAAYISKQAAPPSSGVIVIPTQHDSAGIALYISAPYSTSADISINVSAAGSSFSLPLRIVEVYNPEEVNASAVAAVYLPYASSNYVAAFGGLVPHTLYNITVQGYINHICLSRVCPLYITPAQRVDLHLTVMTGNDSTVSNATVSLAYSGA